MTRKRFIKLLMSHGETPRSARAIAFLYNVSGTPYKKAYSDYCVKTSMQRAFASLGKAALKCGESISKVAQSLKKLTEAIR
ncbi:MAG: hypothetical protein J6S14_10985 [Clostridia bacterium]|nr:hypothetical protein [Clostridia bacterium]